MPQANIWLATCVTTWVQQLLDPSDPLGLLKRRRPAGREHGDRPFGLLPPGARLAEVKLRSAAPARAPARIERDALRVSAC
jgi:hypothetical protein